MMLGLLFQRQRCRLRALSRLRRAGDPARPATKTFDVARRPSPSGDQESLRFTASGRPTDRRSRPPGGRGLRRRAPAESDRRSETRRSAS